MKRLFTASRASAVALLFVALRALAADVTGLWTGHITDPGGQQHEITLDLKGDGSKLTGTLKGGPPMGQEQQLINGKLDGDQLSFEVNAQGPGGESLVLSYKGKVTGDHIVGSHKSPMGDLAWEATKK